ncbi:MAG: NUDIX hydrolase [Elusimicrobiota bacterium]|nr:NUDIX hydrolase [Elusimicrobiota bacterium]
MQTLKEKLFIRNKIYRGRAIDFSVDTVILPNNKKAIREYAEHPNAVAVLAFVEKNKIVLVKQYRYPVRKILYELPAGKLDKGEQLKSCVQRELIEETGYKAKRIKHLVSFYPTPAFSTEILHIFLATHLTSVKMHTEEDEFIEKVIVRFDKALQWIKSKKIVDSKTIIGLLYFKQNVAANFRLL